MNCFSNLSSYTAAILARFLSSRRSLCNFPIKLILTCICPCCLCVTLIVEFALALIKTPFSVMEWFTSKIPC
ncbi:hypothetical protein HN51_047244 [Arachis hypogaea]